MAICCRSEGTLAAHKGCVGPGWGALLDELTAELEARGETYRVGQVKEKFGWLRIYADGLTSQGYDLIHKYERRSSEICEECGEPGTTGPVRPRAWWIRTLCTEHRT